MANFFKRKVQKELDRALYDRSLSYAIARDLPQFYARLRMIALEGEDSDSIKSILALLDRLLGRPQQEVSHDFHAPLRISVQRLDDNFSPGTTTAISVSGVESLPMPPETDEDEDEDEDEGASTF
jgi:hypothetical protein